MQLESVSVGRQKQVTGGQMEREKQQERRRISGSPQTGLGRGVRV